MARNRLRLKANFASGIKLIRISSPGLKILLSENRKLWYLPPIPPRQEGRSRSSRNVGRDAMDVEVPLTSGAEADGKIVWS